MQAPRSILRGSHGMAIPINAVHTGHVPESRHYSENLQRTEEWKQCQRNLKRKYTLDCRRHPWAPFVWKATDREQTSTHVPFLSEASPWDRTKRVPNYYKGLDILHFWDVLLDFKTTKPPMNTVVVQTLGSHYKISKTLAKHLETCLQSTLTDKDASHGIGSYLA